MTRTRIAIHLSLVLAVAISAIAFFVPTDAKAACFYPKRITMTYYGYIQDGNAQCDHPIVSPMGGWPVVVVGERITECDGTVTQWGITCGNWQRSVELCEPICD